MQTPPKVKRGLLSLTVYDGDALDIGDDIRIVLTKYNNNQIRAYIKAPGLAVQRINFGKNPDPSLDKFDEQKVPRCNQKPDSKTVSPQILKLSRTYGSKKSNS